MYIKRPVKFLEGLLITMIVLAVPIICIELTSNVLWSYTYERDHRHWRITEGSVISLSEGTNNKQSLSYEYQVNEISYQNHQEWDEKLPSYLPGMKLIVLYDPGIPQIANVEPGKLSFAVDTSLTGIFYKASTSGTITSYIEPDSDGYSAVLFQYSVNGINYSGRQDLHQVGQLPNPDYFVGNEVEVYYEDARPDIGVVELGEPTPAENWLITGVMLPFLLEVVAIGLCIIFTFIIIIKILMFDIFHLKRSRKIERYQS